MAKSWVLAARARTEFADLVDSLTQKQVDHGPTLCKDWSPKLVTAHAVTFVDVPLPTFMFNVMKHRGS